MNTRRIQAGRLELALHRLRAAEGPPLLLLHALYGSGKDWTDNLAAWPGPVFALDFSGHGESQWLAGGGYYPELFAADADQAASEIGARHVVGTGLGAYVALLLAGGRPDDIDAALLLPGVGLGGLRTLPDFEGIVARTDEDLAALQAPRHDQTGTDPMVRMAEHDIRPVDYTSSFAGRARRLLLARGDAPTPPWWAAVGGLPAVTEIDNTPDMVGLAAREFAPAALPTGQTQG
ncbi:MAG: alpha/beta fold hydrolase [Candidatus Binatia bacterium]|nr:alpha/beta fold hydrolase [Candidatus Binatia bacterium]